MPASRPPTRISTCNGTRWSAPGARRSSRRRNPARRAASRPALESALAYLRPEDVLVVWKLDRLGRSLVEMMRTIDKLRADGIKFQSLTEQLDSESAQGRFFLQIHGAMAEYFLDLNRERTMEGLKAALARGRKGGRPPKLTEDDKKAARAMLAAGDITVAEIARRLGISRVTFYDYFPQARARAKSAQPAPSE